VEIIHRNTDYGLRALLVLAGSNRAINAAALAKRAAVPPHFLQKAMHALTHAGLVVAHRGPGGGYRLARDPADITLLAVMEAIQGPLAINRCVLGRDRCPSAPCALTPAWYEVQAQLTAFLGRVTLASLLSQLPVTPQGGK